ncbi:hypothetical protein BDQ17DRAFT_1388700 [Cyathus striatus]|nr:hypothetical protein BDQ17DRAFT_1388700 [Cyathus striatus]
MVKTTDYTSPPSAISSAKRKKVEDEASVNLASKKQRTRVRMPSPQAESSSYPSPFFIQLTCVARKVPELCKAYTPGKAEHDLNARISRLEQIIEIALPQYCTPSSSTSGTTESHLTQESRRSPSDEDESRSQAEEHDPSGGTFQSGKWYGNSASGSIAPASVLEQLQRHSGISFQQVPITGTKSAIETVVDELEPSAADNLKSLVQECGVSPHKISELLQELPPLRLSNILIDYYFSSINWTRYPVSERDFRSAYNSVCAHGRDGIGATNPNDVRFLPLLFVVLAISVRLAPEHIAGDARSRRVTSLRYYWSSRRSLLIAAAIQPDSLDIVLTRLLSARFLTFDRRITECWSQLGAAVRTAQALGLHRDGSTMGMDPASVQYRPSNIDDESPTAYSIDPFPLSSPTRMTFVILRHQLAGIIGRIVHHFQQVREKSHYSEVIALDEELLKFINNLPPHFSPQPDKSLDESAKYIPVHRFLLITEILFVRISLHRPYLLRRLKSDRYARSRIACFESAMKDFDVRQVFRDVMPKEARDSLSNAYREFQTAMITKRRHAEKMHAILDAFMKDHEGMREIDETTRRELKTIEFLKSKASQMEARTESSRISVSLEITKPEQQAQLLLGLHQSAPAPSTTSNSHPVLVPEESSPRSPSMPYSSTGHLTQSPTFQRLQHSEPITSPTTSGSPYADDESAAQSLLDHWCNTMSNAPIDLSAGGISWGGTQGSDFSGWAGLEGSDWKYWEALVNQIQRAP